MKYHVVVTGSRPEKGPDGKFLPMPKENVEFIRQTLAKVDPDQIVAIWHGAANGVDTVADDYAFEHGIRVKQYPAYWFDPSKPGNVDKGAGLFRNERMVRDAKSASWVPEGTEATTKTVVIGFHNKPLDQSRGTKHCLETANKVGLSTVAYPLPVQVSTEPAATSDAVPF